jgi:cyclase
MKNRIWIVSIALLIVCQQGYGVEGRKFQKISDHVWSYAGTSPMTAANSFGANAGVVVGTKGALVVDTLVSAKEGKQLLADVRAVTKLPVLWVVNTHYHLDHAWGNCVFAEQGATIVGAWPASKLLAENGPEGIAHADQFGLTADDMAGTITTPATVIFNGIMFIDLGGVVVTLESMRHGHCADNLVVWIDDDKTLFSGDLMFVGCHPFVGEGDMAGWLSDLEKIAAMKPEKIIPGHGPLSSAKDINDMKAYLNAFNRNALELTRGKTQADAAMIAEKLLPLLPSQGRGDLANMIEYSLKMKYLPQEKKQ